MEMGRSCTQTRQTMEWYKMVTIEGEEGNGRGAEIQEDPNRDGMTI